MVTTGLLMGMFTGCALKEISFDHYVLAGNGMLYMEVERADGASETVTFEKTAE